MNKNKVGQDFNCVGIKYSCAKSKEQIEQDQQNRISRVFGTALVVCYGVIGTAILAWSGVI